MEDKRIIELFFERSEKAIEESGKKYGAYLSSVAYSILASNEDTEEIVNDTYLRAWNSIPPQKPNKLGAYLATIARNLALDRYAARRKERENTAAEAVLDELSECLPAEGGISVVDEMVLREVVNEFLGGLSEQHRVVFLRRYWYMMPIARIARLSGIGEATVKTILHRTRRQLKEFLEKEGIAI